MKNNKYFIMLSPFLFGLTLFLMYKISFDSNVLILCDDGDNPSLSSLKLELTLETFNYRTAQINYECFIDIRNQKTQLPMHERNFGLEEHILNLARDRLIKMNISIGKIVEIENNIRRIEPSFRTTL